MKARIEITRRPEIADPQGTTIQRALHDLDYTSVTSLRVNKVFHLELSGTDPDQVRAQVTAMCRQVLANPVMEDFKIEITK